MRISDWSSDVCSSDLVVTPGRSRNMLMALTVMSRALAVDHDVLDLGVLLKRVHRHVLAVARLLEPAVGHLRREIGRASCRERVCKYVYISGVAVAVEKNKIRQED